MNDRDGKAAPHRAQTLWRRKEHKNMGPGPSTIGWIIDDCEIICAECLDDVLNQLPVTISAVITDENSVYSHDRCKECSELLEPDIKECDDPDCYDCSHVPVLCEAIQTLSDLQTTVLCCVSRDDNNEKIDPAPADCYGYSFNEQTKLPLIVWGGELKDGYDILDNVRDYLEGQK